MPRDLGLYIEDMLEAARRIEDYVRELDFDAFVQDGRTVDAAVRSLEVLGEAATRVPEEVRERADQIECRKIAWMRDVLAHGYFLIDDAIVWDAAVNKAVVFHRTAVSQPAAGE